MSDKDETKPNKRTKRGVDDYAWDETNQETGERPFGRPARDSEKTNPPPVYADCDHVCWRCNKKCSKKRSHIVHACDDHRIFPHPDDIHSF